MAIAVYVEQPLATVDTYDAVSREMEFDRSDPPKGLIAHHAAIAPDGGMVIFDVWESQDDYQRFVDEKLRPALEKAIGPEAARVEPRIFEIHDVLHTGACV